MAEYESLGPVRQAARAARAARAQPAAKATKATAGAAAGEERCELKVTDPWFWGVAIKRWAEEHSQQGPAKNYYVWGANLNNYDLKPTDNTPLRGSGMASINGRSGSQRMRARTRAF